MATSIPQDKVLAKVHELMEQGFSDAIIQKFLIKQGLSETQAEDFLLEATQTLSLNPNKTEETMEAEKGKNNQNENLLAEILAQVLVIGIIYGLPVLLLIFGIYYIYGQIQLDLAQGVRSLAAAILPLVTTLAFYKSPARQATVNFFSHNKIVAFVVAFVMAMLAAGTASWLSAGHLSGIPIGEMIFSATLAMMVFGNDNSNEISFLNVGAVSGFLMYVIIFGL